MHPYIDKLSPSPEFIDLLNLYRRLEKRYDYLVRENAKYRDEEKEVEGWMAAGLRSTQHLERQSLNSRLGREGSSADIRYDGKFSDG